MRGLALSLFESYLPERSQRVRVSNLMSDKLILEYGVPQGTVLGPTLFQVYVNPLCNLVNGFVVALADDAILLFSGPHWITVKQYAEEDLKKVKKWLNKQAFP